MAEADFPSEFGHFRIHGFEGHFDDGRLEECLALVIGDITGAPPLVRIHSQCLTGDVLHSLRCDCRNQLTAALERIAEDGRGLLIYEHQEGRGIGLMNKLRAYQLQDQGFDTIEANERLGFDADERLFLPAATMLKTLGFEAVRLLTNNPDKVAQLERHGITVTERVHHAFPPNRHNAHYLQTKRIKAGHDL